MHLLHRYDALNYTVNILLRIKLAGPRFKHVCSNLVTSDGRVISWVDKLRYLGVNLLSAKAFSCSFENAKKSFYSAFNNIFGKVGRIATENVVVELLIKKCLPVFTRATLCERGSLR